MTYGHMRQKIRRGACFGIFRPAFHIYVSAAVFGAVLFFLRHGIQKQRADNFFSGFLFVRRTGMGAASYRKRPCGLSERFIYREVQKAAEPCCGTWSDNVSGNKSGSAYSL